MLKILFEGTLSRENNDVMEEISEGVFSDLAHESDDMGNAYLNIDIIAAEFEDEECEPEDYIKIGELKAYSYGCNHYDLLLDAEDFESFQLSDSFYYAADDESVDTAFYYEALNYFYDKIRLDSEIASDILDETHVVFLHRFFIEPEYRGKGIGNYIANNLAKIIYTTSNIKPIYCVGIINPDDKTEETKAIQKKTFENAGFIVDTLGKSTIFGKCIYDEDI